MINGGATTVQDEREPGLDFYFVFHVRQSSARGCRFSFVFILLLKCLNVRRLPEGEGGGNQRTFKQ